MIPFTSEDHDLTPLAADRRYMEIPRLIDRAGRAEA
jgi:hypothetical protein